MNKENSWWQATTFDFIKVPKDLFRAPQYSDLSPLAKLLYGFLLDRTSLSASHGDAWADADGSCFVYFPITEIMERFSCGHDKAAALLQELEQSGLITRTLKSRGKPYRIVVQPFAMSPESRHPPNREQRAAGLGKFARNKTEENKTEGNKMDPITSADRARVEQEIKGNICYDVLLEQIPKGLLDGIVDVVVDTLCTPSATVRIAGNSIPREEVCRRFLRLDQMDICYVHGLLKKEPSEIRSLRGYILARLYEAKNLSDTFYDRWAQRDMNGALI